MFTSENFAEVDRIFSEHFDLGGSPGLVFGVTQGGEVIHSGAFGVSELDGKLPTVQSAFRVASITKSFTGAATLLLRDRGLISLESPIADYLPELHDFKSQYLVPVTITVEMLLTMSAGFPIDNQWADRVEAMGEDEFGAYLAAGIRFESAPGQGFAYSNLGYALLARIISRVEGRSYIQFVTEEILNPLKLTRTTFDYEAATELAVGYVKRVEWEAEPFIGPGAFSSIGGVITTVDDLALWSGYLSEAFNADAPERGPLSKATRREMQEIQRIIPEKRDVKTGLTPSGATGYGYGVQVEEDFDFGKIVGHAGGYPGFGSYMRWHASSQIGVIAFANGRYAAPIPPCTLALKSLLGEIEVATVALSEDCLALQGQVNKLISAWSEEIADELFGFNMDLDQPRSYRKKLISESIVKIGGLKPTMEIMNLKSKDASNLAWTVSGSSADLLIEMWLTPDLPGRLQFLTVTAGESAAQ